MKRRDFIKAGAATAGMAALSNLIPGGAEAAAATKVKTSLPAKGWIKESARRVPVVDNADVVVLGGGPAGVAAAVSAAREGADVMLLERGYFLGGLWTGGIVLPLNNTHGMGRDGKRQKATFGIVDEICRKLDAMGMITRYKDDTPNPVPDPEACKYVLEEMIQEAGVRLLYNCQGAQVIKSGDAIEAIIVETKSGRLAIRGKVFVDCSGDGDILEWAGEAFENRMNQIGAMWRVGGAGEDFRGTRTPLPGVRNMWMGGETDQDGLDVYNQTRLQLAHRKKIWEQLEEDRKKPGGEGLYLLETPSLLGVRITRVMKGRYVLTLDDTMKFTEYPDSIGLGGRSSSVTYNGVSYPADKRPVFQIPYRSLVPLKCPNLLVAGRCFSFDEGITYDAREISTCLVTGQAAGVAAAMSAAGRNAVADVDIARMQKTLKAGGAILQV